MSRSCSPGATIAPDSILPNTSSYHARNSRSCGRISGLTFPGTAYSATSSDRGHGSISPRASAPYLFGLDRPNRSSLAAFAPAPSSRSTNRHADARSLRPATESLFRLREDRDCHRHKDLRPTREAARSCPRPTDRSRPVEPARAGPAVKLRRLRLLASRALRVGGLRALGRD
jgi:hypothetical protein